MFRRRGKVDDAVDDFIWDRVVRLIEAAHRGDVKAHAAEFRSWPDQLTIQEQRRMEVYLWVLLGHLAHRRVGGDYSSEALRTLSESVMPATDKLVRADVDTLMEVFRDALGVPEPQDSIRGVALDLIGSAALGAMVSNPRRELAELRPKLSAYCEKHSDGLAELEERG